MRKVTITKKSSIKKGAKFMGLTLSQIIAIIVLVITSIIILALGFLVLNLTINVTMSIVFLNIVIICGIGFVHINGMSLLQYIILLFFKGNDIRYYSTKGMLDKYEQKEEKK